MVNGATRYQSSVLFIFRIGYSSHTLKLVNDKNESFWVKFHYKPDAGVKNFTGEEAAKMRMHDPDHATRDLFEHIRSGKEASDDQVIPEAEGYTYKWNIFDVTKVVSFTLVSASID
uniref:Catalase core domain-containing protein n=1 Tax=Spongospora subterranea TaxID=70186 RepID=A0A0H5QQF7_9EUKA|eukprot:CRZ03706.1 hypothetical protein [Spongospora subterranea]